MAGLRDYTKGQTLNKRLDCLEEELKELHEKILQKRLKKSRLPAQHCSNESLKLIEQKNLSSNLVKYSNDGNDWYSCLKSITRSIAQGSEAIRKIASLSDATSLGNMSTLMPTTTTDQESSALKSTLGLSVPDKELMAYHVDAKMKPFKSSSDYSGFEKAVFKGVGISRSDGRISNYLSTSTVNPRLPNKSLQECKKTLLMENHRLKQQLTQSEELYAEVNDLKKRLKEETKKRVHAERKAEDLALESSCMKNSSPPQCKKLNATSIGNKCSASNAMNGLEDLTNLKAQTLTSIDKMSSEELPAESRRSPLEKKYMEEREKRMELEGLLAQIQQDLVHKTQECAHTTVGQKLALALAEQFRSKYEKESKQHLSDGENYLVKALNDSNKECSLLQEELSVIKNKTDVSEEFKERALKAETEVKLLQKQIQQYKRQNPLESLAVQSVLEKHKQAYSELLMAKKCSDAEYKARCRSLEGEVARLHNYYEKRIKTLNVRIKELMMQLEEKLICFNKIEATKDNLDIVELKKTISEMDLQARQRDAMIASLTTVVADKETHTKQLENEKEEAVIKFKEIQNKYEELQKEIDNKNEEIGKLLHNIELKSDEIAIKGKMLEDQSEKIGSLRNTLNDMKKGSDESVRNREQLVTEIRQLKVENSRLLKNVNEMSHSIMEAEKFKEGQEKNVFLLHQLEEQVYNRQKEWEFHLTNMSKEKDQAIQTAKFATQKLVSAVGEYESQLKSHKQLQHLLKASLQEKDQKLQQALNELERLNAEANVSRQQKVMTRDFHTKLNDACLCSDVIDEYEDSSVYS